MGRPAIHVPSDRSCLGLACATRLLAGYDPHQAALLLLIAGLFAHALYVLLIGLGQPISDLHGFRQTQTAISAYWLWRGGPWLAYETPILGAPGPCPFELPVYQYLMALLRMVGVPIVVGGRLLSFGFFVGLLWPLAVLLRSLGVGRTPYLTIAALLLASPLYVFWSRTVMIESCALFFGLAWLAALSRVLLRPGIGMLILTIIAGVLGINAKSTTFVPFGLLGAALICWRAIGGWRRGLTRADLIAVGFALVACAVPFVSGVAWVVYSDRVKLENPLGANLTSTGLTTWNFGTLAQRKSAAFWRDVVRARILPDTLGYAPILALVAMGAAFGSRRLFWPAFFALLGFVLPLLTFTNLHLVHNYYQYANAAFLIAAVGFGVASISEAGRPGLAFLVLAILAADQVAYYRHSFAQDVTADYSGQPSIQIGSTLRERTAPDAAVLVIGADWSAEIPFYGERKAVMLPFWGAFRHHRPRPWESGTGGRAE